MIFDGKTDSFIAFINSKPVLFLRKKYKDFFELPTFYISRADFASQSS